jgi:hypothetical protein
MSDFGVLDLEEMMGEGTRLAGTGGGGEGGSNWLDMFVPMPEVKVGSTGSVTVRILPPVKGGKLFQYTRLHLINGRKYHCPKPLINGKWDKNTPCPICDYYNALWRRIEELEKKGVKEEAEDLKREARLIKPIERYYYNAIVRELRSEKGVEKNVGPRILSVGKILHKMIVRAIIGDENEKALGDVTHPKTGYDFVIRKELRGMGKDAFPNYDRSSFARESSPLGTADEIAKWQSNLHDLTKLRTLKGIEELETQLAIHRGLIPDTAEQGWSIDEFDAKYKGNTTKTVATGGRVSKPSGDGTAAVNIENMVGNFEAFAVPTSTDVPLDMDEFTKEIQELEGK